jgi:hypothetical protein
MSEIFGGVLPLINQGASEEKRKVFFIFRLAVKTTREKMREENLGGTSKKGMTGWIQQANGSL